MPGRPQRRALALAATAALTGGNIPDPQGIPAAQLAFEAAAVRALLTHHGDAASALRSIAPNVATLPAAEQRRLAERTFAGNRFLEITRAAIDLEQSAVLDNLVSIALDRQNPDAAVRACSTVAYIAGWITPAQRKARAAARAAQPSGGCTLDEALALFDHEPEVSAPMGDDV